MYLRSFGSLSAKPLELRGSWPGLDFLNEIHRSAWPTTRHRSSVQLMKRGARQYYKYSVRGVTSNLFTGSHRFQISKWICLG